MEVKMGTKIAALRRARGWTQEQLAEAVGVSPPAVSKWETDRSCPDIALLCPLARALGTTADELLGFEEELSEKERKAVLEEILALANEQGVEEASRRLTALLREYPSSIPLKHDAVAVLQALELFHPLDAAEHKEEWRHHRRALMESIRRSGDTTYFADAVSYLAALALTDGELDRAEELLRELPTRVEEPTLLWSLLYQRRGQAERAREVLQKRLFKLVHEIQNLMNMLMSGGMEISAQHALEIGDLSEALEDWSGCNKGMSAAMKIDLYLRQGKMDEAMDNLLRFVNVLTGPVSQPNPLLFGYTISEKAQSYPLEIRKLLMECLNGDSAFDGLRGDARFAQALDKLKNSIDGQP